MQTKILELIFFLPNCSDESFSFHKNVLNNVIHENVVFFHFIISFVIKKDFLNYIPRITQCRINIIENRHLNKNEKYRRHRNNYSCTTNLQIYFNII